LGYNGIDRIAGGGFPGGGSGGGPPGGGPGGAGNALFGGEPGIGRMFEQSMGTEVSWLLPAALIGLVAALWLTRKAARKDQLRASLLLWGGWLLVTAAVFSFMDGIIHPYYTVALAPAIAALVGISVTELWQVRDWLWSRLVLATTSAATGVWAYFLLDRTPDWLPALRCVVLAGSVVVALMLALGAHRKGQAVAALAAAAILFGVAAPAAYAVETVATAHNGPISTSGPSKGEAFGHPGGQGGPGGPGGPGGRIAENAALVELVQGLDNRWSAATVGSMGASSLELETGASVMAIGGFTGSDNSPTLAQFQGYVADHEVRYFIEGERFGPPGHRESGVASEITAWVKQNYTPIDVGGTTVYDLSAHK